MKIPVFIICRDRVNNLRKLVKWLEKTNQAEIILVDNDSRYPPLLEYLNTSPHLVYWLKSNHSKWAPWKEDLINKHPSDYFVVCDPDVLPVKKCPLDAIEYFIQALKDHPNHLGVGPALEIKNLPNHYAAKQDLIKWENRYWEKPVDDGKFFEAVIDSAFITLREGSQLDAEKPSLRANYPYVFRHETWYMDTHNPSEEDFFYISRCDPNRAHWVREIWPGMEERRAK